MGSQERSVDAVRTVHAIESMGRDYDLLDWGQSEKDLQMNETRTAPPSAVGLIFGQIAAANPAPDQPIDVYADVKIPRPNDWTIEQAYMCLLLAAVYADGEAVKSETEYVRTLIERCSTMRGQSGDALAEINLEVMDRMRKRQDYVGEACEALPRDMHRAIFAHCVDIVLADGRLENSERDFLDLLMEKMDINPERVQKIMEVIFEKNRY